LAAGGSRYLRGRLTRDSERIVCERLPREIVNPVVAEYGVSAERIRQIEANALTKLKKRLAAA
jgi:DNA-directed RNA polymerase sigma subunit (sigma70/sigma32)